MPFHCLVSQSLTAGAYSFALQPSNNFSLRIGTEADAWAHFRMKSLSFRLLPQGNALTAAGFVGGVQDSPPITVLTVAELLPSCLLQTTNTIPTEWVKVRKEELAGPFPWYKSIAGAADPTEEAPGIICVTGTGTATFLLEMRGIIEFKTAVATANTPLARDLRERVRAERLQNITQAERALLLKILGAAPTSVPLLPGGPTKLGGQASV